MFPIGDSPNPSGRAWVNLLLIAINIGVFVMLLPQMSRPADPSDPRTTEYLEILREEGRVSPADLEQLKSQITEYDLTVFEYGSRPSNPSFLDMLFSMFLHGGWMHLLGNMLFLWIYGNNVEFRLGRFFYLLAYLGTGFAASFGDILLRPDSQIPGVGASGAISGVLGMYFIWFPRNRVRLLLLIPPAARQMELGARWVLGFYIVVNNLLPAFLGGGEGGIAYGAHIGGFVGGLALALVLNLRERAWPGRKPETEEKAEDVDLRGEGLLPRFRAALSRGDLPTAAQFFFGAHAGLLSEGMEVEDAVRLGEALAEAGEAQGALAAYERGLQRAAPGAAASAAHIGAARALLELGQPTRAYQHVYDALTGRPDPAQAQEARRLMDEIRGRVGSIPRRFAG